MMFDVVMMTVDRSPKPNFLAETLGNLSRAGVFTSPLLGSFSLIDSGSADLWFALDAIAGLHDATFRSGKRNATENAAYALHHGAERTAPWVLFLEDDIDVCARFLESVAAWLAEHEDARSCVYPLGANYEIIKVAHEMKHTVWDYPVDLYYGTLAVAMRSHDAENISQYLMTRRADLQYDLHIAAWAKGRGIEHFRTPVPSFIQHIGYESTIRPGGIFHQYPAWAGRDWAYQSKTVIA